MGTWRHAVTFSLSPSLSFKALFRPQVQIFIGKVISFPQEIPRGKFALSQEYMEHGPWALYLFMERVHSSLTHSSQGSFGLLLVRERVEYIAVIYYFLLGPSPYCCCVGDPMNDLRERPSVREEALSRSNLWLGVHQTIHQA